MKLVTLVLFFILLIDFCSRTFPKGIKDIKSPVYFPADYLIFIVVGIAIFLIILSLFLRKFFRRKASKEKELISVFIRPAHEIAYEALEALRKKNFPAQGKTKKYYFELSDIVRQYLENRFSFRAPTMTTEEFLYMMRQSGNLAKQHKDLLKQFLTHCDLVKFAKYGPTGSEIETSFNLAKKLVDETKENLEPIAAVK